MMTHLHVKSTEPKATPQPVSTELCLKQKPNLTTNLSFLFPTGAHAVEPDPFQSQEEMGSAAGFCHPPSSGSFKVQFGSKADALGLFLASCK